MILFFSLTSGSGSIISFIVPDSVLAAGDFMYFPYPVYTVSEDCQVADILLKRKRTSLWMITANYATADLTATAGSDYTAAQGTKTMTLFIQDRLSISITDDMLGESDEEFTITLSGQYTLDDPANGYYKSCTVVIADDDGGVALSDNNYLASLEVNAGTLDPVFSTEVQCYEIDLEADVESISIMACTDDCSAVMELNGNLLQSDEWSNSISLTPGQNTSNIVVEAENGELRTYTLILNRDILPSVSVFHEPLIAVNGNSITVGSNIEYNCTHTITIEETSTNGWGFRLWLFLDEFMETLPETVNNPTLAGNSWLDIKIPSEKIIDIEDITITNPNMVSHHLNYSPDIAGASVFSGRFKIETVSFTTGNPGIYTIVIVYSVMVPSWLPEGTIINSDTGTENLGPNDIKQVFDGIYVYEIDYELERIMQP